nr:MAG TPA: hypothetical protein [Caudoviricetes sp.]
MRNLYLSSGGRLEFSCKSKILAPDPYPRLH